MAEPGGWAEQLLLLGLGTARFAAAFLMLPLFAPDTVPATVRNAILIAFGFLTLALLPPLDTAALGMAGWIALYVKEIFVGLAIGLFFGTVLWALTAAGEIIDTMTGSTMAQVVDPLGGHQTSLNAAFLGRLANLLFVSAGGLALIVGVVLESHAIWPMDSVWPDLRRSSVVLFEMELGRLVAIAALVAAPALVILFLIDLGLGLINRFAQQLNVFSLSLSIKTFAGTFVLLLLLPAIASAVLADVASRSELLREILSGLAG
jgi:type III secretion protein T